MILRRICQLSLTRITHQVSRAFDLKIYVRKNRNEKWGNMSMNEKGGAGVKIPRFMLAAPNSGSGKTLITCGLLQALKNRGLQPASFKCGPDYIDPLFHTKVLGVPSRNLDTYFTGRDLTCALFGTHAQNADLAVMEGVMGFYDGVAGVTCMASSWELADVTDTPVILVINMRGMSLSVAALIRGFQQM